MRFLRLSRVVVALAILSVGVTACARPMIAAEETEESSAAKVTPIEGTDINRVVLTDDAVKALALTTGPVSIGQSTKAASSGPTIPVTALIYDPQGRPWTYVMSAPRTFERQPVVIGQVKDGIVYLNSGPPVGTPVVTVGAPELLGTEYGVGEE